jgi:hypothetical protein
MTYDGEARAHLLELAGSKIVLSVYTLRSFAFSSSVLYSLLFFCTLMSYFFAESMS